MRIDAESNIEYQVSQNEKSRKNLNETPIIYGRKHSLDVEFISIKSAMPN